jgi:hypothetical protein
MRATNDAAFNPNVRPNPSVAMIAVASAGPRARATL